MQLTEQLSEIYDQELEQTKFKKLEHIENYGSLVILSWIMLQKIDDFEKDNDYFVRAVKFGCNQFKQYVVKNNMLDKLIDAGFGADRHGFNNITDHTNLLVSNVSKMYIDKMGIDQILLLSICALKILQDPESVVYKLGIPIGKGENIELLKRQAELNDKVNKLNILDFEKVESYLNNIVLPNSIK